MFVFKQFYAYLYALRNKTELGWLNFYGFGLSEKQCSFSIKWIHFIHFEFIWLINVHSFSEKPNTQKVSKSHSAYMQILQGTAAQNIHTGKPIYQPEFSIIIRLIRIDIITRWNKVLND